MKGDPNPDLELETWLQIEKVEGFLHGFHLENFEEKEKKRREKGEKKEKKKKQGILEDSIWNPPKKLSIKGKFPEKEKKKKKKSNGHLDFLLLSFFPSSV